MNYSRSLATALIVMAAAVLSVAQSDTDEREAAIRIFRTGNDLAAILALEPLVKQKQYSSDAELINLLGLAYQNAGDTKGARKMLEKAVKLQPQNAVYRANLAYTSLLARQIGKAKSHANRALQIDPSSIPAHLVLATLSLSEGKTDNAIQISEKMIAIDPANPLGYALKSDGLIATLGKRVYAGSTVRNEIELIRQSVEVLEEGVGRTAGRPDREGLGSKLDALKAFHAHFSKVPRDPAAGPPQPEPGVTPVKIISKPQARYTDQARSRGVQGAIRVAALLGADGRVHHVLIIKGLDPGLDRNAVAAARSIVFSPKLKDGVPVATVVTIDYTFSIY